MRSGTVCNGVKRIIFFGAFSIFESDGITKHLMTGPSGNSQFCFPSTSMFPSASPPRGTLRVSGKQNSLFTLWPVIKCLLFAGDIVFLTYIFHDVFMSSCDYNCTSKSFFFFSWKLWILVAAIKLYHNKKHSICFLFDISY